MAQQRPERGASDPKTTAKPARSVEQLQAENHRLREKNAKLLKQRKNHYPAILEWTR